MKPQSPLSLRIVTGLAVACVLLLVAELFIHRHAETTIDHLFGFYGWVGLAAAVVLALGARLLRRVVERPGDVYDGDR